MNADQPKKRGGRPWPLAPLLALIPIGVMIVPGAAAAWQLDVQNFELGTSWQTVSAHWSHWNFDHFLWDWVMFSGLAVACERADARGFRAVILLSMGLISFGLLLFAEDLERYRGLSGLDAGLYTFLALHIFRTAGKKGRYFAGLALVGFLAKTLLEGVTGTTVFVQNNDGFVPVPLAHALGALAGLFVALGLEFRTFLAQVSGIRFTKSKREPLV